MQTSKIEKADLKAEASGRWDYVLSKLAPQFNEAIESSEHKRGIAHVDCPIHGGTKDFRLFKDFLDTGGAACSCGIYADGFALLMAGNRWSFQEVLQEVHAVLYGNATTLHPLPPVKRTVVDHAKEDHQIRLRLNAIWTGSVLLSERIAKPAWDYFESRGLVMPQGLAPNLRFHPSLAYYDEDLKLVGSFPALVARAIDPQGRPVTLHRTYLDGKGGKAPVEDPKKLCSHPHDRPLQGSAIRLFPIAETIGVAEGLETSLAVTQLFGIPCWPMINATLMAQFQPPAGVKRVLSFGDKDRSGTGQRVTKELVKRLWSEGFKAGRSLPDLDIEPGSKGVDWLDVLQHKNRSVVGPSVVHVPSELKVA